MEYVFAFLGIFLVMFSVVYKLQEKIDDAVYMLDKTKEKLEKAQKIEKSTRRLLWYICHQKEKLPGVIETLTSQLYSDKTEIRMTAKKKLLRELYYQNDSEKLEHYLAYMNKDNRAMADEAWKEQIRGI